MVRRLCARLIDGLGRERVLRGEELRFLTLGFFGIITEVVPADRLALCIVAAARCPAGLQLLFRGKSLWLQAALGVMTLIHAVPLGLGVLHQAGAALVLAVATVNLWLVRRSQPRLFMSGPRSTVL